MTSKVFIDTNIILDILLEREPFFNSSQNVILELGRQDYILYISCSSITDLYYICKKAGISKTILMEYFKELLNVFEVLLIDKKIINNAVLSDIKDFEDAVQILACKKDNIDLIITRNKKDFKNKRIKVQTPDEYLK